MPKSFGFGASESRPYVVHFCKNKACNRAFLDIDRRDAKEPPRSHHCQDCKAQGLGKRQKAPSSGG
jgi:hypothetical protein